MAAIFRRKNYFTKKGFQTRFVLPFLLASSLANSITVSLFIFLARNKIDSLLFSMRMPPTNAGGLLFPVALIAGMAAVIAVGLLFFWASRSAYHKMEGPLNSIRDDLHGIAQGDLRTRVMLRENDEFKDFAEEVNAMSAGLNRRFAALKRRAEELARAADSLRNAPQAADRGALRQQLIQEIEAMKAELGGFQL